MLTEGSGFLARRISGVPWHGAGRFCFIPLDGEVVRLSCEDCLEVFLVAADALGMGLGERDDIYYRLYDRLSDRPCEGAAG